LRRWEDLRPQLDARGVEIVTICADTPQQVKRGRSLHGVKGVMLSDHELTVTDRFNLRHERTLAPKPGVIASLPIPTTILVDAEGTVRWIDQARDYQVRSHPERVLAAIDASLPGPRA
jgi:peroxiredoxin